MKTDAVVPALGGQATIQGVVRSLRATSGIGKVIVSMTDRSIAPLNWLARPELSPSTVWGLGKGEATRVRAPTRNKPRALADGDLMSDVVVGGR